MKLRQLPELYLRGSIANETMKNLSQNERDNINALTKEISKMQLLAGHKYRFIEKLGQTIGGDYYENKSAAEQEYNIAIWRALVYLLHHTDYNYECMACKATTYMTHKNKPKAFDRRYPKCPACNKVMITNQGDSTFTPGSFVSFKDLQNTIKDLADKHGVMAKQPLHTSPITPVKGKKKVQNHEAVLNDPTQLVKYFSEFIWNYFRQVLRENEVKHHQIEGTWISDKKCISGRLISGPADQVAVEEINSLLVQLKVQHRYEPKANPIDGFFQIEVELLLTNQGVSCALRGLIDKYREMGVEIKADDMKVMVRVLDNAPIVEAHIVTPQPVCVQGRSSGGSSDEDDVPVHDALRHRIRAIGGASMQEDGLAQVESQDLINIIRENLSDGAQKVYDIMLGQGDTYDEFLKFQASKKEKDSERPPSAHIARFLGTSPRQVNAWVQDIRVQCLAHNIGDV